MSRAFSNFLTFIKFEVFLVFRFSKSGDQSEGRQKVKIEYFMSNFENIFKAIFSWKEGESFLTKFGVDQKSES